MSNFLVDKIKDIKLTKNELKIANFFLTNLSEACFISSNEIARKVGTSNTSIIRFSKTLGYSRFTEFQKALQENLSKKVSRDNIPSLSERFTLADEKANDDILKQAFELTINNISATFEDNSLQKYEQLVQMVVGSRRKYIIGFRGAKGIAVHFARTLRYFTDNVIEISSADTTSFEILKDVQQEDVVIIITFSRYGKVDCIIHDLLIDKSIPFCVIADKATSPVARNANLLLLSETKGLSFFNSTISTMFITEVILSMVGNELGIATKESLDVLDKYIRELLQ